MEIVPSHWASLVGLIIVFYQRFSGTKRAGVIASPQHVQSTSGRWRNHTAYTSRRLSYTTWTTTLWHPVLSVCAPSWLVWHSQKYIEYLWSISLNVNSVWPVFFCYHVYSVLLFLSLWNTQRSLVNQCGWYCDFFYYIIIFFNEFKVWVFVSVELFSGAITEGSHFSKWMLHLDGWPSEIQL